MPSFEGQIKVWSTKDYEWKYVSVHPTRGEDPYRYATRKAAQHMLDTCYPGVEHSKKQVVEVAEEPNVHTAGW